MKRKHIYSSILIIFMTTRTFLRHFWPEILKKSSFGMIFFKRNFWARGWSVVGIYGVLPESRRFKLSTGGSLGPNQPFYNEKFQSENGLFLDEK
jgi:hypothetical protein